MKELLEFILKVAEAIVKLVPALLDVVEDLFDDGKINSSNKRTS